MHMLRLSDGQVESLWDEVLPEEVRELPEDLASLDTLLRDSQLLAPISSHWRVEAVHRGRPTIPMEVYVRLMAVKQRTGWGYETLVREVSDSLHLRRFCLLALGERVPHVLSRSVREARRLALAARARARGRRAQSKPQATARLEQMADRAARVTAQIRLRIAGEPISERLVSMFDPDARPVASRFPGEFIEA
jgi:IS5 family transposase